MDPYNDRGYLEILKQLGALTQPTMDISAASTYTGISKSHLHKLARGGRIPSTKPGGRKGKRYFTRFNLDAYMASNPSTPAEGGAA